MIIWEDVAKACREEINGLNDLNYNIGLFAACYMQLDIQGDWKHTHARFKWWLQDFCEDNNLDYEIINCMNIDNNDEDSYRAIYEVVMREKTL